MRNGVDRFADEHGRVVDDPVVDARRKVPLQALHRRVDVLGGLQRVGTWTLEHANGDRRLVVEQAAKRVAAGPSSSRATSDSRVICPLSVALTMMLPNSTIRQPSCVLDGKLKGRPTAQAARRGRGEPARSVADGGTIACRQPS